MNGLTIRIAGSGDMGRIVALVESAYRGESSRAGWTTEADLLDGQRTDAEEVAQWLAHPRSVFLLGERDGALVGSVHLRVAEVVCHLGMFAVTPAMQAQGMGKAMLREAEGHARRAWQCAAMEMHVITLRAELIAWYERRGYRRTGVFEAFPYGNSRFGLPRRPDLRLEVLRKELS